MMLVSHPTLGEIIQHQQFHLEEQVMLSPLPEEEVAVAVALEEDASD
jgi:hypothetical protein